MSLVVKKRATLPSLASDPFDAGRLLSDILDFSGNLLDFNSESVIIPDTNIIENENNFRIELAAPGLERADFKVEVNNDILTIIGEKNMEDSEVDKYENYKRREFSYHFFKRSFLLPKNSLPNKVDAKYENGVLYIWLPKKEFATSKSIKEIKIS